MITDAGRIAAETGKPLGWYDVSTLKEPYRIEGKKTLGLELAEQLDWRLPDVIVYPTGGGTGLIGMWKVFGELAEMGWLPLAERLPRMVTAQAEGCAPIVRAFEAGDDAATRWNDATTAAWGLRVPAALGDRLMLRAIRDSRGTAVAVDEDAMARDMLAMRAREGVDACEEGGAALAALRVLLARGQRFSGPVVLFNTGSALKYGPRA
ncbi:MAG: hypothetical protein NVSMB21_03780 [Vulcanimicrobiaceae bacterium]